MGRLLTRDYICPDCGRFDCLLRVEDGDSPAETQPCPSCGKEGTYAPTFGSSMKAAYPDGTKRLQGVRESRVLEKAQKKAMAKKDIDTLQRIHNERQKMK